MPLPWPSPVLNKIKFCPTYSLGTRTSRRAERGTAMTSSLCALMGNQRDRQLDHDLLDLLASRERERKLCGGLPGLISRQGDVRNGDGQVGAKLDFPDT